MEVIERKSSGNQSDGRKMPSGMPFRANLSGYRETGAKV